MITVVARWDEKQIPCNIEWQLYRQLRGAFKVDRFVFVPINPTMMNHGGVHQFETMDEALENCTGKRVFLEPTGKKELCDIPSGDIVLIIGNTDENNLKYSSESETYKIKTTGATELYGSNAAAIALSYRVE